MKKIILALSMLLILFLSACNTVETSDNTQIGDKLTNQSCSDACENYKNQCLTLVPGATQQIYEDGIESCMQQCKDWTEEKANCIATTLDCASMTSVCEL